jgi:hypothetical protein
MAANYLHGIETLEISRGARPIRIVKSAVIALLRWSTAPMLRVRPAPSVITNC